MRKKFTYYKEILRRMRREAGQDLQNIKQRKSQEYNLDLDEVMPKKDKARIFNSAIEAMHKVADQFSIEPPPGNLLDRLIIVKDETFNNLLLQEEGADPTEMEYIGTCLPNRLGVLNWSKITEICKAKKIKRETAILHFGIHELWHSLEYHEIWAPQSQDPLDYKYIELARRVGLVTKRPGEFSKSNPAAGLNVLNEGATELLTFQTTHMSGSSLRYSPYRDELNLLRALGQEIGLDPIIQAKYSKRGFRKFVGGMNDRYGEGALRAFVNLVRYEDGGRTLSEILGERKPPFTKSLNFLAT